MKPREAAFRVVYDVLYNDGYSTIVLENIRNKHEFNSIDSSFITNISMGTLRNSIYLEYVISRFSSMKLKKISPSVLTVLKTGAYQILFMDRVPDSAACNESVKVAGKFGGNRSKGFVNGVLRSISRGKDKVDHILDELKGNRLLAVKYSFSMEAISEITSFAGEKNTKGILKSLNLSPSMCIRKNAEADIEKLMVRDGIEFEKGNYGLNSYYISPGQDIGKTSLFKDGLIAIQDEGAQEMVEFLNPQKGEILMDACAAPGGKTAYIDFLTKGGHAVTAYDSDSRRVLRMSDNLKRLGSDNTNISVKDMTLPMSNDINMYDAVLVDAPCSGLGTSQRRPEIKLGYKKSSKIIDIQAQILDSVSVCIRRGGRIVYGTCTLTNSENYNQIKSFLLKHPEFTVSDEKTILPDGRRGGYYMAKLRKNND